MSGQCDERLYHVIPFFSKADIWRENLSRTIVEHLFASGELIRYGSRPEHGYQRPHTQKMKEV